MIYPRVVRWVDGVNDPDGITGDVRKLIKLKRKNC